jgi:ABC-type sulfate transport system permease component
VQGATAVAAIMLMISFTLLLVLNFLQIRQKRRAV